MDFVVGYTPFSLFASSLRRDRAAFVAIIELDYMTVVHMAKSSNYCAKQWSDTHVL